MTTNQSSKEMPRGRWLVLLSCLCLAPLNCLSASGNGLRPECDSTMLIKLASVELRESCIKSVESLKGDPDSADMFPVVSLRVRDCKHLDLPSGQYLIAVLGCVGDGEVIAVSDSGGAVLRARINIPAQFAGVGSPVDMNGDGQFEIPIQESSGSHGQYILFVTITADSLHLIRDDSGNYQFFAPGGGIELKDVDGDGRTELILWKMDWTADQIRQANRYEVYKLNRGTLMRVQQAEK
jgi:hypothetical protein